LYFMFLFFNKILVGAFAPPVPSKKMLAVKASFKPYLVCLPQEHQVYQAHKY
jgi:hypothetical protein